MRNRFFSLFVLLLVAVGMKAQTWTEPKLNPEAGDALPEKAYFYHVGQQMFLVAGTTWGTHAALTPDASKAFLYELQKQGENVYKLHCAAAKNQGLLGRSTDWDLYTDFNNQTAWSTEYEFLKENGYWHVRTAQSSANYGASTEVGDYKMGWDPAGGPNGGDVDSGGNPIYEDDMETQTNVSIYMLDPETEGAQFDWAFVTEEATKVFALQSQLYGLAKTIVEESLGVDYEQYTEAYNSGDVEAMQAAYDALREAVVKAQVARDGEGATQDNPVDFTKFLVNPNFDTGNTEGWTVDVPVAPNTGYQNNAKYPSDADYIEGEPRLVGFIEAWVSGKGLGDGKISQVVKYLPDGLYELGVDIIATRQYQAPNNEVSGVQLFAKGGDIDKYTKIGTENGKPEHYTLRFVSSGGDIEMGLRAISTDANWLAADNFTLQYFGEVDVWYVSLDEAVNNFEEQYGYMDDVRAEQSVKEEAERVFADARDVRDGGGDYEQAYLDLAAATAALETSVADYRRLKSILDTWEQKIEAMAQNERWSEVADDLQDVWDKAKEAYDEGSYTKEDIDALDNNLGVAYAEGISSRVQPGDDLTFLLTNPGFDKNTSGWTVASSGATPAWGGSPVNLEDGTVIESGVGEVWRNNFDISQTIQNMPAGLYVLSVKAFERNEDDQNVRSHAAELYAVVNGLTQTGLVKNIHDDATDMEMFTTDMAGEGAVGTENDKQNDEGKWIPNGRCGANVRFHEGYYETNFNILVDEISDIVVGIRNPEKNRWVLFDDFRIVFKGDDYSEAILNLVAEARKVDESQNYETGRILTKEVSDQLQDAIGNGEDVAANAGATKEESLAAINALREAIVAGNDIMEQTAGLWKEWELLNGDYRLDRNEIESDDTSLDELLGELADIFSGETEIEKNADIAAYSLKLKKATTVYVQYNYVSTATEENPADITPVIYNPDGNGYAADAAVGAEGWNVAVGTVGYGNGNKQVVEFYSQAFDVNQTIYGLAPGYYVLGVQAYYRDGLSARIDSCLNKYEGYEEHKYAKLYAGDAETYVLPISADLAAYQDVTDGEGNSTITVNGESIVMPNTAAAANVAFNDGGLYQNKLLFEVKEGQESVVIGMRKTHNLNVAEDAEAGIKKYEYGDWTIYDNWTLLYLGQAAPGSDPTTDVKGVDAETAPAKAVIYNLAGQRVAKAQKGVYIINGKKVVVK